jgi:hypothetical protein
MQLADQTDRGLVNARCRISVSGTGPPAAFRKQLATNHHTVARAVARLGNGATVKRLLTLASH